MCWALFYLRFWREPYFFLMSSDSPIYLSSAQFARNFEWLAIPYGIYPLVPVLVGVISRILSWSILSAFALVFYVHMVLMIVLAWRICRLMRFGAIPTLLSLLLIGLPLPRPWAIDHFVLMDFPYRAWLLAVLWTCLELTCGEGRDRRRLWVVLAVMFLVPLQKSTGAPAWGVGFLAILIWRIRGGDGWLKATATACALILVPIVACRGFQGAVRWAQVHYDTGHFNGQLSVVNWVDLRRDIVVASQQMGPLLRRAANPGTILRGCLSVHDSFSDLFLFRHTNGARLLFVALAVLAAAAGVRDRRLSVPFVILGAALASQVAGLVAINIIQADRFGVSGYRTVVQNAIRYTEPLFPIAVILVMHGLNATRCYVASRVRPSWAGTVGGVALAALVVGFYVPRAFATTKSYWGEMGARVGQGAPVLESGRRALRDVPPNAVIFYNDYTHAYRLDDRALQLGYLSWLEDYLEFGTEEKLWQDRLNRVTKAGRPACILAYTRQSDDRLPSVEKLDRWMAAQGHLEKVYADANVCLYKAKPGPAALAGPGASVSQTPR
jgi:hypothetical protein